MKRLVKSMTTLGFALLLAGGAVGCSGAQTADKSAADGQNAANQPAAVNPGDDAAPGDKADEAAQAAKDAIEKAAAGGDGESRPFDVKRDSVLKVVDAAMDAKSRWDGDVLHVKIDAEQGTADIIGPMNCRVLRSFLMEGETAIFQYTDGTTDCTTVYEEMDSM